MSLVTDIILLVSLQEKLTLPSHEDSAENIEAILRINGWLNANFQAGLSLVSDGAGGTKASQSLAFAGAFSYFKTSLFVEVVSEQQWIAPESVQVLIKEEEDAAFTVTSVKCKPIGARSEQNSSAFSFGAQHVNRVLEYNLAIQTRIVGKVTFPESSSKNVTGAFQPTAVYSEFSEVFQSYSELTFGGKPETGKEDGIKLLNAKIREYSPKLLDGDGNLVECKNLQVIDLSRINATINKVVVIEW